MKEAWRLLFESGAAAFPSLSIPPETFEAFLEGARGEGRSESAEAPPDGRDAKALEPSPLRGPDLYLACAVANGMPTAVELFDQTHISQIPTFLARHESNGAVIDEVQQRVRVRILVGDGARRPRIHEYSGRGALGGWVRVVALREHASLARSTGVRSSSADVVSPAALSPELAALRSRYLDLLNRALAEAVESLDARQRTLFRLHYVDGLSLEKIGALYDVHKATVSRWLADAREQALARALVSIEQALGANGRDAKSLFRLFQSQLELSLSTALA